METVNDQQRENQQDDVQRITNGFPKEHGFKSAAVGLAYIQSCYNTSIEDIILGKLWPEPSPSLLTFSDIYEISNAASFIGRLDLQIDWLSYLQDRFLLSELESQKLESEKNDLMWEA